MLTISSTWVDVSSKGLRGGAYLAPILVQADGLADIVKDSEGRHSGLPLAGLGLLQEMDAGLDKRLTNEYVWSTAGVAGQRLRGRVPMEAVRNQMKNYNKQRTKNKRDLDPAVTLVV